MFSFSLLPAQGFPLRSSSLDLLKKILITYAEGVISEAGFKVKAETFQREILGWQKKEKNLLYTLMRAKPQVWKGGQEQQGLLLLARELRIESLAL